MMRIAKITLLVLISITTLGGCLVEKKNLTQISRTTDNLRVYQAGDAITYDVSELQFSDFSTRAGTLRVEWFSNNNLLRPGTTTPAIPVLKEVTTLTFDSGASETGTVRYISQDDITGEITLHATQSPDVNFPYYWLSKTDISNTSVLTESLPVFTSPMSVGLDPPAVSFFLMEECNVDSGVCPRPFGQYSDDMNIVGDTTSITTNLGAFSNPFQISFYGTTIPESGFPIVDVRNICGTSVTTHTGTMYVMPEIGIIQMTNTCDDAGDDPIQYTIKVRSTSFNPFP